MNPDEANERLALMSKLWGHTLTAADFDELLPRIEQTTTGTADAAIGRLGRTRPDRWPTVWQWEEAVQACRPTAVNVHPVEPVETPKERFMAHLAECRQILDEARARSKDPRRAP